MADARDRDEDDEDDAPYDDLGGVDLATLDLETVELEVGDESDADLEGVGFPRWLTALGLATLTGFFLWLPRSDLYNASSGTDPMFVLVSVGAIITGLMLGRTLWVWGEEASARWAARQRRPLVPQPPPGPPTALARWGTLTAAITGVLVLIFVVPRGDALNSGRGGTLSDLWFLTVFGAIGVAFLFWRFFQLQGAYLETLPKVAAKPFVLPYWFRWVTLAVLVALGIFAGFGMQLLPAQDQQTLEFTLAAIGFMVGVGGAIWLAKRVEEGEKKIDDARAKRAPQPKQTR